MKIDVLCSNAQHPVVPWLNAWAQGKRFCHEVALVHSVSALIGGDVLFLISCGEILTLEHRSRYKRTIVLHASDLPKGRGFSPHIWAILEGASCITVSAIDAEDAVDSGAVWATRRFDVPRHALYDEINRSLFEVELELMDFVLGMIESGRKPVPQPATLPSHYPRRSPKDSELNPEQSIAAQFDRMRVCDPIRFPAFFRLHGYVYEVYLRKRKDDVQHED